MAPLDDVRAWLMARAAQRPGTQVPLADAHHRILAEAVPLPRLPPWPVAAIDGLAVLAARTEGASDYAPIPIAGTSITAGTPLPPGTDAVLPPSAFDDGPVALAPAASGSFVVAAGHDAPHGTALAAGTLLRPVHLALLGQAGITAVVVIDRPTLLLEPGPLSPMLKGLAEAEGAVVTANPAADLVLRLGPDRATWSDHPPEVSASVGGAPALTLPADPFRCLVLFTVLVAPALRRMGGHPDPIGIAATLGRKITSSLGQVDAVPVRHDAGLAIPLGPADGCGLLAAAAANGLLLVPANSEGYAEGAMVEIIPLG